jgi:MFS family permease
MELVSGVGDGACWVAVVAALLELGAGPAGFALAAAARLGPRALLSAPAGVLADHVDHRRLLVSLDLARGGAMVAMAAAWGLGASTTILVLLVLVTYTVAAPYRPAVTAAMPLVVGERDLSWANARVATVRQLMTFVGPLVGAGGLWLVASPAAGLLANGMSFVTAAVLVARVEGMAVRRSRVRHCAHRGGAWRRDLSHGWTAVRTGAGLLAITVLVFVMYVARGAELTLHVLLAEDRLDLGATGLGLMTGAVGLGAVLALPLADRIADTRRPAATLTLAVATTAVPFVALAFASSLAAVCGVAVVIGFGVVVFEVASLVLIQRAAPLGVLGRIFGIVHSASNGGKLVGALLAPALVALVDLSGALVVVGVAVAAVTVGAVPGLARLGRASAAKREALAPRVAVLARLPIFADASRASLERMARAIVGETYEPGTVVVRQGDQATDLFVAVGGRFRVLEDDVEINTMVADTWFGEIGLMQHRPRTASVVTSTAAEVWRIPGDVFLGALQEQAAPPASLIDAMTDRLARSRPAVAPSP